MKNILISTIVRNEIKFLDLWYAQLKAMVERYKGEFNFFLSVYENDSQDGSALKLNSFDFSFFGNTRIVHERLNTPYFIGGMHPTRTMLLGAARNESIYGFKFLDHMDFILSIEPDTRYDIEKAGILLCDHEKIYGKKFDILSGKSIHVNAPERIYDSWGTRITDGVEAWHEGDNVFGGLEPLWSTFNCFVLYNAEPIKKRITFGGFNERLKKPDCDTVVICENFRKNGYDKIFWHTDFNVEHFCE